MYKPKPLYANKHLEVTQEGRGRYLIRGVAGGDMEGKWVHRSSFPAAMACVADTLAEHIEHLQDYGRLQREEVARIKEEARQSRDRLRETLAEQIQKQW
jgi:hypothetical protein